MTGNQIHLINLKQNATNRHIYYRLTSGLLLTHGRLQPSDLLLQLLFGYLPTTSTIDCLFTFCDLHDPNTPSSLWYGVQASINLSPQLHTTPPSFVRTNLIRFKMYDIAPSCAYHKPWSVLVTAVCIFVVINN
jgi:hypothetical protein